MNVNRDNKTLTSKLVDSTITTLANWVPITSNQISLRNSYLAFARTSIESVLRSYVPGHFTASTIIFNECLDEVLLTLHPRIGAWVQLGGHCEATDSSIHAAARREALEESGFTELSPVKLAQLHTHAITCSLGIPTYHLDLQFAAIAPNSLGIQPLPLRSSESLDLRWWSINNLPTNADPEMPLLIDAGLTALAAQDKF